MNQQTIDQIKTELAPLAEKLGQGAEFTWEVVVKQQYVEAMVGVGYLFLALVATVFILIPWAKKLLSGELDDFGWMPFTLVALWATVSVVYGAETAITHLINPEYYALQEIINMVK